MSFAKSREEGVGEFALKSSGWVSADDEVEEWPHAKHSEIINKRMRNFESKKLTSEAKKPKPSGEGVRSSPTPRDDKGQIWPKNLTKRKTRMNARAKLKID